MTVCPRCQTQLTTADIESRKCANCGAVLDQVSDIHARPTIDINATTPSIDRDSIEVGSKAPPSENLGATVDISKLAKTVDSIELPASSQTVDQGRTVDVNDLSESGDTSSVEIGSKKPPSPNMGATIELGSTAASIDSINLDNLSSDSTNGAAESRIDHTVDSVDLPRSDDKPGKGTVSDKRVDVTIDSIVLDPSSATHESHAESRIDQTIDSVDIGRPPGSGTVEDRRLSQTIESVVLPNVADKPGTVVDRPVNVTVDSSEFPPLSPKAGTVLDRGQATYESNDVSSGEAKQVDQMWKGANVEKASPRMTIKGREPKQQTTKTSLVIQPRHFREAKSAEPVPDSEADYDLIKMLGQGGMGVVYSARQASIDRAVAVKMLKPDMARDEGQRNKFLAEAVITGDLDHPNIVPIYDLGKNREGALFYAMKKVQGTPWDRVIHKKSLPENLDILLKVADAVAFAHNRSVVHRDLKPENIMLGDFGEVLVMDWGLALPFGKFEKSRSIQPSASMGGTPAYMAPEMATGPFDRIGPTSDVYLLGAILYEIVTGRPPHTGKDVMKCLFAAAKNDIQPTDKRGELIDIARKAMATKQADRYQNVQDFQAAIREYEAHSASITMASRAEEALQQAETTSSYDTFAQAVFEFQEAVALWPHNSRGKNGVSRAKLAYASAALSKADLDLAESLLDPQDASHQDALVKVAEAKRDREARQQRLNANRRLIRILITAFFITVTAGLIVVSYQSVLVRQQRDIAVINENEAKAQKALADAQKIIAEENEVEAKSQKAIAEVQRDAAKKARDDEAAQRKIAQENEQKAIEAEELAVYEAYIALIGLAAAKIEENAFGYARELLNQCEPKLRNWEWGRLMYLCQQSVRDVNAGTPIDAIAFSADGKRFATGGWSGLAQVFNTADGSVVTSITHAGSKVYAIAFSPVSNEIATGSSDPSGYLSIWNADTGELIRKIPGHQDGVFSVAYTRDGKRLLTGSFDNTARLWDAQTGKLIRTFAGHTWWVWCAAFSPDERQIVTASQDGTALVWSVDTGERGHPFMGHEGPVYTAAFSPDGQTVVTGGYDKRVLVWNPSELVAFDFKALVADEKPPASPYKTLEGHLGMVRSVAFSGDGKLIISGGHDNTVKIWSAQTAQLVKTLRGHDSWVRACTFAPGGRFAISGGHDGYARIWDVEGYQEARVLQGKWLQGHDDAVMAVAFSPKGQQVVTASRDRTARAWDVTTGQPIIAYAEGHSFLASTAVIFPDGRRVATAAVDSTTRTWDMTSGVQLLELKNTGRASAVAVAHDGRSILTGGNQTDGVWAAQLWNAESGELIRTLKGHAGEVSAVAFSPDDRFCFTGDSNGRGVLWDISSGAEVARLQWHTSKIAAAVFLADGQRLLTASDDKTVAQWDTRRLAEDPKSVVPLEKLVLKHEESVLSLDLVSNQRLAITCTTTGAVRLWDVERAVEIRSLPVGQSTTNAVALSPDGQRALTVHPNENVVRLWDVKNGREMFMPGAEGQPAGAFLDLKNLGGLVWSASFSPQGNKVVTIGGNEARLWDANAENGLKRELMSFSPHTAVVSVGYSADGSRVITGSWDGTARIWNAKTGLAERKLMGGHTGYVHSATFSPTQPWVLTCSEDKTAKIWDINTGEVVRTLAGHSNAVRYGTFSPNGKLILTASDDKTARIWNAENGEMVVELKSHEWGVRCAAFSSDAGFVVTGSDDNSARMWEVATGKLLRTLAGHTASVTSVAVAPDGKRILTASQDFTCKLWDAETGKEILNLKGHTQELTSVAFSHDGRQAMTGSQDGTAIIWPTADWKAAPQ